MKTVADEKSRSPARGERAPTVNLTLRLKPSLLNDLRQHAQKNETSIAAEAETRLSQPITGDLARMIQMVVSAVEERAGKRWSEDDSVKRQCRAAAEFVLNVLLGSPIDSKKLRSALDFQMMVLENAGSKTTGILSKNLAPEIDRESMKESVGILKDWSEGHKQADEMLETILGSKS